jgi:hypothetical protein
VVTKSIQKDLPKGVIVGSVVVEKCGKMEAGGWRIEHQASRTEVGGDEVVLSAALDFGLS